jgi:ABC-type transport system involved in multi-copper enzyme maturation permease subunit
VRHVNLIAVNFVREQRWPILVLMGWVVLLSVLGLVVDPRATRDDILFIFKQGAVYGVVFAIFFGASAIYNERKTRRILAVLSKSIGRGEYVTGLLAGVALSTGIYWFSMGVTGSWVLGAAGFSVRALWEVILCLIVACMLSATVAVLCSTLLNPLFATMATFLLLGVPAVAAMRFNSEWAQILPAYSLIDLLMRSSFDTRLVMPWGSVALAVAESVFFWLISWWVFAQRDIAVAVD